MTDIAKPTPLMDDTWTYVDPMTLDDFTADDWAVLDQQRVPYFNIERVRQAMAMMAVGADVPTFGYQVNNLEHCLQAATMAMRDGLDEETVVVTLFHDIGFLSNNESHGEFAATFLKPYVSARHVWMLERHMYFQAVHCATHPAVDPNIRERWRGHPDFEYTANWVERYDINSFDPAYDRAALEDFEPLVQRIFANPRQDIALPA